MTNTPADQRPQVIAKHLRRKARGYDKESFEGYLHYMSTGDSSKLQSLRWVGHDIHQFLAPLDDWGPAEQDYLNALVARGEVEGLSFWIGYEINKNPAEAEVVECFLKHPPATDPQFINKAIYLNQRREVGDPPAVSSVGRYTLALSDEQLQGLLRDGPRSINLHLTKFLAKYAAERLTPSLMQDIFESDDFLGEFHLAKRQGYGWYSHFGLELLIILMGVASKQFAPLVEGWQEKTLNLESRWYLARVLYKADPSHEERFRRASKKALEQGCSCLQSPRNLLDVIKAFGSEIIPDIITFATTGGEIHGDLTPLLNELDAQDAKALFMAGLLNEKWVFYYRVKMLSYLLQIEGIDHDEMEGIILDLLQNGLPQDGDGWQLEQLLGAVEEHWTPDRLIDHVWPILSHKRVGFRRVAWSFLGRRGKALTERASQDLANKDWNLRLSLVHLLSSNGDPQSAEILEQHLEREANDNVRDQIYRSLMATWKSSGRTFTLDDIRPNMERNKKKLAKPLAKWLNADALPPLPLKDGGELDTDMAKYLLFRQKRSKEVAADIEAQVLINLLDHPSTQCGDYAIELLNQFVDAQSPTRDRWAVILAALLGDDRFTQRLASLTSKWVTGGNKKLAEMGAECLGVINTEVSLSLLDNLALRYRNRSPKLADAARSTLEAVARQQGISVEEFGDKIVPWLDFESDKPRVFDLAKGSFELRIGADGKFKWFDRTKGKAIRAMPSSLDAETKAMLKEQAKILEQVRKNQISRLETLMVRQHRWPVGEWQALYCHHPILQPFTVSQVWAVYTEDGSPSMVFRRMEDGTFVDAEDDEVSLPDSGSIGIVHPLDLDEETIASWQDHLADYEIEPHFPQLDREITELPQEDADKRSETRFEKVAMGASSLRSRMHKYGWVVGTLYDGYGLSSIVKAFPRHGVDFILSLNDMPYFGSYDEGGELGTGYFLTATTRKEWYEYQEPKDDQDPRIKAFKDVPTLVYSEVMRDLNLIAGDKLAEAQSK